jgi:putative ABC transport system permease protein
VPLLAWKNLLEDRGRFAVALAGITFAVALITIQTGVYNGFVKSAGLLIDESSADIWVTAQEMRYVELTLPIPYSDVQTARNLAGVELAEPMIMRTSVFKGPEHRIELIRVVGFDPDGRLFRPGPVSDDDIRKLRAPNTILVDRANLAGLNLRGVGDKGIIGPSTVRLIAITSGTQPVVSASFIYTSLQNQRAYLQPVPTLGALSEVLSRMTAPMFAPPPPTKQGVSAPLVPDDQINYILIKAKPGVDLGNLEGRLERALPGTRAFTRQGMAEFTRAYWRQRTGIGFILGLGALVGIIVGMVVVGQILYTSVTDHIREYGTMKAMGAADWELYQIIAIQGVVMAILGFVPGLLVSVLVASYALAHRGTLILVTPTAGLAVLAVTVCMCVAAAVFAMQRVIRIDPAEVFKA